MAFNEKEKMNEIKAFKQKLYNDKGEYLGHLVIFLDDTGASDEEEVLEMVGNLPESASQKYLSNYIDSDAPLLFDDRAYIIDTLDNPFIRVVTPDVDLPDSEFKDFNEVVYGSGNEGSISEGTVNLFEHGVYNKNGEHVGNIVYLCSSYGNFMDLISSAISDYIQYRTEEGVIGFVSASMHFGLERLLLSDFDFNRFDWEGAYDLLSKAHLKDLGEFNKEAEERVVKNREEGNGIACPECDNELKDIDGVMTTYPARIKVKCMSCGHIDERVY